MLLALALLSPAAPQDLLADLDRQIPRLTDTDHLAVGDLEPDGDMDIVALTGDGAVVIRQGANGRYAIDGALAGTAGAAGTVLLLDYDGDGDLDIHVGRSPGMLFQNDGASGFTDVSAALGGTYWTAFDVAAGDVDGDGDTDIVQTFSGSAELLRNNGGTFSAEPIGGPGQFLLLLDADGDSDLDILRATEGDCDQYFCWGIPGSLYANDGTGVFTDAGAFGGGFWTTDVAAGDVDADGDLDVAVASADWNETSVLSNQGVGGFTTSLIDFGTYSGIALTDVDMDGLQDAFVVETYSAEHVYRNTGTGFVQESFRAPVDLPKDYARAISVDLDGDGDDDILTMDDSPRAVMVESDGTLVSATPWAASEVVFSEDTELGDLNGDGAPDGVRANNLYFYVLENDGEGELTATQVASSSTYQTDWFVELGDVDGDGDLDAYSGGKVDEIYLNDGNANLAALPGALPAGLHLQDLLFVDIDGDADLDAASPNSTDNRLFRNDGTGIFTEDALFPAGQDATTVSAADFDLDGDIDFVFAEHQAVLYRNLGGTFATTNLPVFVDQAFSSDAGDVDLDGNPDLLVGRYHDDSLILLGTGTGGFLASSYLPPTTSSAWVRHATLVDLDDDGDLDAVTERVWLNDGTAMVQAMPTGLESGFSHTPVAIADLDLDGDLDVLFDGRADLRNLTRQVGWSSLAAIGGTLALDVHGDTGTPWFLAWSPSKAQFELAGFGTLLLDPASTFVAGAGTFGTTLAEVDVPIPSNPALVGVEVNWQALVGSPLRFSNRASTELFDL